MKLAVNEEQIIKVEAKAYYSTAFIEVENGEVYSFHASKWPLWIDLLVPCTANGFHNPLLKESEKRVAGAKCFELCGSFGENDSRCFRIGMQLVDYSVFSKGNIHFFANDHKNPRFYRNNIGYIKLKITRHR